MMERQSEQEVSYPRRMNPRRMKLLAACLLLLLWVLKNTPCFDPSLCNPENTHAR